MSKRYILVIIFYIIASLIVFSLVQLSPDGDAGQAGLGSKALVFFMILITILIVINIIKSFTMSKRFLGVALVHFAALAIIYFGIYS